MKQLYRVDVTLLFYADSKAQVFGLLAEALCDVDTMSQDPYPVYSVPGSWHDAIPFGEDDDRTCGEILRENFEARYGQARESNR